MPIYEYEPTIFSLDEEVSDCCYFEVIQSSAEKPLQNCPTCGKPVHRVISNFQVASANFGKNQKESAKLFAESGENQPDTNNLFSSSAKGESAAKKAARLAMRHVCYSGCRH